jgi:Mn-dependent DtxR family transcriptional regulator
MRGYRLTPRQKEFLEAVERLAGQDGGCSFRALADEMGVAHNAAVVMVTKLVARGYLRQIPPRPSILQVVREGASAC